MGGAECERFVELEREVTEAFECGVEDRVIGMRS